MAFTTERRIIFYPVFLAFLVIASCSRDDHHRRIVDLSGMWQFAMDSADKGVTGRWYAMDLTDSIELPGTMDLRKKGYPNHDTTTRHLNRIYKYEGPAWYRKKIHIPKYASGKHIVLSLERTKSSTVWVDDRLAGTSALLQSAQQYDLTDILSPGEHTITIRIDNSLALTPYGNVHIYSDDTQTNWNGILGKLNLEFSDTTYISDLQVFPDIENKKFVVNLALFHPENSQDVDIRLKLLRITGNNKKVLKTRKFRVKGDSLIRLEYFLEKQMKLWDEYQRPIYQLKAIVSGRNFKDSQTVSFGMRKFEAKGTQFSINGRTVFLRGKHDACVFPLTGFPPMDVKGWLEVFRKARNYGINHYRFHSWCPPEAAFTAADREGIYLQAELPFWGGLESDTVARMLREEGLAMLKNYANHPSFVMFSHGNEIWSGHDRVEQNILAFKAYDNRPLYTMGSNNSIGYAEPRECSDFFVAARTPYAHDTIMTHTRLTQAFVDSRDGGILNTETPSADVKYDYVVSRIKMPVVSHEIGQYQIYPDYAEIEKYKGVLKAWNLEVFRNRFLKSGMEDLNEDFHKASGAWSALCYKAEMEAAIRTKGFGGFQLLDLQDFPGQGTALVGILDAFMDDKGVISKNEWLSSCNDIVVLLSFPKYCWTNHEIFKANIQVANYSDKVIDDELIWKITREYGDVIASGRIPGLHITNDGLNDAGDIEIPFETLNVPARLRISVSLKSSGHSNSYPIWVYPVPELPAFRKDIYIAYRFEEDLIERLKSGARVLYFPDPDEVSKNSTGGLFPPEFWNYGMFKGISEWLKKPVSPGTLGILTDPRHPVFKLFPTDYHTNWQWFSIVKASHPLILDHTVKDYRPIVQVIDNLERNHKLGLIFEFAVGEGKLLVCMSRLNEILDKPEAYALYNSLLNYMESEAFNPEFAIGGEVLRQFFQ